jgi:YVTN family beta-propeller protein
MIRVLRTSLAVAVTLPLLFAGGLALATGSKWLPTEWSLSPPTDLVVATGTLPESVQLTSDGAHLIVVESGAGPVAIRILDPATLATQRKLDMKSVYGQPLPDASGAGFWIGTGADDTLAHIDAASGTTDRTIELPKGFWPASPARSPDGTTIAVAGDLADSVALADVASGKVTAVVKVGHHPAGAAFSRDGKSLYVANWGEHSISIVDVASGTALGTIDVGLHPEVLLPSHDGTKLYVTEADDDAIGIVDLRREKRIADVNVGVYDGKMFGASPTALALSGDGARLYIACSAANAIVVLNLSADGSAATVAGAIPTGWYPTAVSLEPSGRRLYVANGQGEGSRANPKFQPNGPLRDDGYVATSMIGSIRRIPVPDAATLASGMHVVRANAAPFLGKAIADRATRMLGPMSDEPGRAIVSPAGPIKHVIYVIKENRSFDQVLGDLRGANGDASLVMFGAEVTPNQHALARRFGIFDNTYADAEISPDGHNWSTAAFANDYLEKMWPQSRRRIYDFEDGADASVPHNQYLWNAAARAGISFRDYGEFVTNPGRKGEDVTTHMPDLIGHIDPKYQGYDTAYRDEDREAEWAREFALFVRRGDLPVFEIIRLPSDHTSGTTAGRRTPAAMIAENDLAFGRIVDAVSHSRYWQDTAIFAIEDDAQNGPDHVDDQRTTFYLASPYARGGVRHEHYSTAGVVRTIELILGLPPLSAYDAAARPMYAAFGTKPNLAPFDVIPARVDLEAKNVATSYRSRDSARLDFSREDRVPPAVLNDILWHAVKGVAATPPPYGAFER